MFAVIKSGGKQYRVAKGDIITVEKLFGEPGDQVALDTVLMWGEDGKAPTVGAPTVDKAQVFAEVVEQSRADKIIVFKKQRRKGYRRKKGHRQAQTILRILEVSPTGAKPKTAAQKTVQKKEPDSEKKPVVKKKAPAKKPAAKAKTKPASENRATTKKKAPGKKAPAKKVAPKKAAADGAKDKG